MGQLLTANVATSMYWLGRYLERIELTLYKINKAYDKIIDVDKNRGVTLYKKFDIELEYTDAMDFLDKAIRGDHPANLANIMHEARENAIISRINIDSEAFGEIMELHALLKGISKSPLPIDYKDIDTALSLLGEIWGAYTKKGHRRCSDYFLKLGRLIEEVDFRIRFNKKEEMTNVILKEIDETFKMLDPDLGIESFTEEDENIEIDIMNTLSKKIDKLIVN